MFSNGGYVKNDNGGCNISSGFGGLPSTDSGHGGACFNGEAGANNFPLRYYHYYPGYYLLRSNQYSTTIFSAMDCESVRLIWVVAAM